MESLKDLRKQAGLTAKEVAGSLGVTLTSLYRYEQGKREISVAQVPVLSQLYDCTIEEVVFAACASIDQP